MIVIDTATLAEVVRLPLPAQTMPMGMAFSPDGHRLYVSNLATGGDSVTSMTIVDALSHKTIGAFPTAGAAGPLAVSADGARVFVLTPAMRAVGSADGSLVAVFDTNSHSLEYPAGLALMAGQALSIATHPSLDRLYVGSASCAPSAGCSSAVEAFDTVTLASLGRVPIPRALTGLTISGDGSRLHVGAFDGTGSSAPAGRLLLDSETLVTLSSESIGTAPALPVDLGPAGDVLLLGIGDARASVTRLGLERWSVAVPGEAHAPLLGVAAEANRVFAPITDAAGSGLVVLDPSTGRVTKTIRTGEAVSQLVTTPEGAERCGYALDSTTATSAVGGGTRTVTLSTGCAWKATSSAQWVRLTTANGTGTTTIGLTIDPNGQGSSRRTTVAIGGQRLTVVQAGVVSQPPFGSFDTPHDGTAGISGSLAVTGWALDDVEVSRVQIYRDNVAAEPAGLVLVGDASFEEGARPDVEAVNPGVPLNSRAGWGYLMLTNYLPANGNGTFRLHAYAEDVEGQLTLLGSKKITVANKGATRPFGSIDRPAAGEEVSGTIVCFGWALTPQPAIIPTAGSTIDVLIDGKVVGHPTYNQFRADIAELFPGHRNTDGAVGFFVFDTRTLADGTHSIAWVIRDSLGRGDGVGSRFFRVVNNRPTLSAIAFNPNPVNGGGSSIGTVTLSGPAPAGGLSLVLKSSGNAAAVPSKITIPSGAQNATFPVTTPAVSGAATVMITASLGGQSRTASLTVMPALAAATLLAISADPSSVDGGAGAQGTATLTAAAPAGGAVVALNTSSAVASVPANVTIAAGKTTGTFAITTFSLSSATTVAISGSLDGVSRQATLTVRPAVALLALSVAPGSVDAGEGAQGTVTLAANAPAGGLLVTLTSNNGAASVPPSVKVAAGSKTATFPIATNMVPSSTSAVISGALNGGTKNATLAITKPLPPVAKFTVTSSSKGKDSCVVIDASGNADCAFDGSGSAGSNLTWHWSWRFNGVAGELATKSPSFSARFCGDFEPQMGFLRTQGVIQMIVTLWVENTGGQSEMVSNRNVSIFSPWKQIPCGS